MDVSPEHLEPGTIVADYRIEELIGRGAMAVVYRATQLNLDRPVAFKVLIPELAKDQEFVYRFFNEARAAAAISHPNIIQAYDAGVAEGDVYYFAMEFVEGVTLEEKIRAEGRIRPRVALSMAIDIAGALQYGWEKQKLTHGDIKPENIMLNRNGETKLADFGLAKIAGHDFQGESVMLTPLYAAPERIRGEKNIDECRADIYSFGATLYHMVTGSPPFPGNDPALVMSRHLEDSLEPACRREPAVPRELSDYLARMLAKNPADRPPGWDAVVRALKRLRIHAVHPPVHPPARPPARPGPKPHAKKRRRTRPAGLPFLGFAILAAAAIAGISFWLHRPLAPAPRSPAKAPAAPAEKPGNPPPPVAADAAWIQLKGRLGGIRDPRLALKQLNAYAARHPGKLPADFHLYKRHLLKIVQRAAQRRLERRIEALEAAKNRDRVLREVAALLQEKVLTPNQRRRLETLRDRLPKTAAPSSAPGEKPGAAPGPRQSGICRKPPPEELSRQAYFSLLQAIGACGRRSNGVLQAKALAAVWLRQHPGPSPEEDRVRLLLANVLEPAAEFIPSLVKRRKLLLGKSLTIDATGKKIIRDVSPTRGIRLAAVTRYGETSGWMPWAALAQPRILVQLGESAYAQTPLSLETARPWAGFLFVIHDAVRLRRLLDRVTAPKAAKQIWLDLLGDLQRAPHEVEAFQLWRNACEHYLLGEREQPLKWLRKLTSHPSEVLEKHAVEIRKMRDDCAKHTPAARAAALLAQAQQRLETNPQKALALAGTAWARYGELDFPGRASLDSIRKTAIERMSEQIRQMLGALAMVRPHLFFAPFTRIRALFRKTDLGPGTSLALYQRMLRVQGHNNTLQIPPADAALLRAAALLEIGDWKNSEKCLQAAARPLAATWTAAVRYAVAFTRAAVTDRYDGSLAADLAQFRRLRAAAANPADASPYFGPTCTDFLIVAHLFSDSAAQSALAIDPVSPSGAWQQNKRLFLGRLILHLERGDRTQALAGITRLLQDLNLRSRTRISPPERPFFTALKGLLEGNADAPFPVVPVDAFGSDYEARLALAVLARVPKTRTALQAAFLQTGIRIPPAKTLIGGEAWAAQATLQAAFALERDDPAAALAAVQNIRARTDLPLTGRYPALTALAAGLEQLLDRPGAAWEMLSDLRWSTVAAAAEKKWARAAQAPTPPSLPKEFPQNSPAAFWFCWNAAATCAGHGRFRAARQWCDRAESSAQTRLTLAEKRLLSALRGWCKRRRKAASQPGSGSESSKAPDRPSQK